VEPSSAFCIALAKVLIIAGPTASGKSAFANKIAFEKKGVILNGDSLQVYKGLEILTAQPSLQEQHLLPHRLYGFLEPHEMCSAGKWLSLVLAEIENIHTKGDLPIVVGGTGLYLKALIEGLVQIPPIDSSVKATFQGSQEKLYAELKTVDIDLAERTNPLDRQRTIRGLEVFYGTGKPLSFWQVQKPPPPPYEFEKILLMPPKEDLEERMTARLEKMLAQGVIEEVSRLLNLSPCSNALKAIGLREFRTYIHGHCSLEEAKALTLLRSRQYAKRQRTWFRHQFLADTLVEIPLTEA
jgi:tRNA dimethylallyltransferase